MALSSDSSCLLFELPAHVAASDDDLHAAAARMLLIAHVRSVTVDCDRTAAVVRLKPARADEASSSGQSESITDALVAPEAPRLQPTEVVSWINPTDRSISFIRKPAGARGWRKQLYLILAGVSLLLGLLGIVLPGLPTTPFVLLGSYFLVRSSTRLHDRLIASRLFGGVLRDWYVHRGLRPHVRARAVAVVALVVAVSLIVTRPPLAVVLGILALAACGLTIILRLPSVGESEAMQAGTNGDC
jgi:uncharacterized membrane protein YbaN (DUF454 family)